MSIIFPCSGSKGVKLVEQKVPASYVHLQDVVRDISEERKAQGKDPVLHTEQYRSVFRVFTDRIIKKKSACGTKDIHLKKKSGRNAWPR